MSAAARPPAAPGASALIGHTGFVGGSLHDVVAFRDVFNSKTISAIRGRSYDLVVCAGLPAAKWIANRDPEADWRNTKSLIDCLREVEAHEFVLISTVDVYPRPIGVDERTRVPEQEQPYGAHRLAFEKFVVERFPTAVVVRLPALFGPGLRKNVLFDLLRGNMLDAVQPASEFQWYHIGMLWQHLKTVRERRLDLVNLVTEPLATSAILERCFPTAMVGAAAGAPVAYDVHTLFADAFGGRPPYLLRRDEVLVEIEAFVGAAKAGGVTCG